MSMINDFPPYHCAICGCELRVTDRQLTICTLRSGIESVCMSCENKIKEYSSRKDDLMSIEEYYKLREMGVLEQTGVLEQLKKVSQLIEKEAEWE